MAMIKNKAYKYNIKCGKAHRALESENYLRMQRELIEVIDKIIKIVPLKKGDYKALMGCKEDLSHKTKEEDDNGATVDNATAVISQICEQYSINVS